MTPFCYSKPHQTQALYHHLIHAYSVGCLVQVSMQNKKAAHLHSLLINSKDGYSHRIVKGLNNNSYYTHLFNRLIPH